MHAPNLRDGKRDERLTDGSRETQPETVSFPKEKNHRANAVDYSIRHMRQRTTQSWLYYANDYKA